MSPHRSASMVLAVLIAVSGSAQDCYNSEQYPTSPVTAPGLFATTTINTCNFAQEHSRITSVVAGGIYIANVVSPVTYITARQGTADGVVLASGYGPLTFVAATDEDVFLHWNVNEDCATNNSCISTSITRTADCEPATVTATVVEDCAANAYSIELDILDLGDGGTTTVTLEYTVSDGASDLLTGIGPGVHTLGPFEPGTSVDVVLHHGADEQCNVYMTGLTSTDCPILVDCDGPGRTGTHCSVGEASAEWTYSSIGGQPIGIVFQAGTIQSVWTEDLTIRDGSTPTAPILYEHLSFDDVDLAGLTLVAPSGSLYISTTSYAWTTCADGVGTPWDWTVSCLDCEVPSVSYAMVLDCDNNVFFVEATVNTMGEGDVLELVSSADAPSVVVPAPGVYSSGPYPNGTVVQVLLEHPGNGLCHVPSSFFDGGTCPVIVDCDAPAIEENYCYPNNADQEWYYRSGSTMPIAMVFTAGTIESSNWDQLIITDGPDGAVLFEHTLTGNFNLAGLQVVSGVDGIFMHLVSDGLVSCASGSMTTWEWTVGCMDCVPPTVTYSLVQDCDNSSFFIEANVTNMGSASLLELNSSGSAPMVPVTGVGTFQSGPYSSGTTVSVVLTNPANALCNVPSAAMTDPICPEIIECAAPALAQQHCYANNEVRQWHYRSDNGAPLILQFSSGSIESALYDQLVIRDGPGGNILYQNGMGETTELSGVQVISTTDALLMELSSDGIIACSSGSMTTWNWTVDCLDCTFPEATFSVVPSCVSMSYYVEVDITSTGSNPVVSVSNTLNSNVSLGNGVGTTTVGPFPLGQAVRVSVVNPVSTACTTTSTELVHVLTDCIQQMPCAATGHDYCYTNSDTAWFFYQSAEGLPLGFHFDWGAMGVNDYIQVLNGLPPDAPMIYMGNMQGNLAGLAVSTTNPDNILTLRIVSNPTISCADGSLPGMYWVIECGGVGVSELGATGFVLAPNPTNGPVRIQYNGAQLGNTMVRITDLSGRTVLEDAFVAMPSASHELNVGHLANGTYVVALLVNGTRTTGLLQVAH